jgi:serine/threonine-protein kinase
MASVWLARLTGKHGFTKLVAIKMILPKFAQDDRFEKMFLDEAGIASQITHSNVAQILDLGEQHDILYLAMEWVDGDALSKLVRAVHRRGGKIPLGIVLRVLADICGGLHAAHELRSTNDGRGLGVVHRDVSPQNILVSQDGIAKLIDFGIAKARDRVGDETSSGTLKGKIHFMAPEQALGKPVDRRADLWAIGSILYYLMAGKPPYEGDNQFATLHLLTSGLPPAPLSPSVHPAVRAIVQRALTHAVEQRYQTAADMQVAIEGAMVAARVMTTTSDVAAFVREHMADHAQRRQEALEYALSAAAERSHVARVLENASATSSSGISDANKKIAAVQLSGQVSAQVTAPAVPSARGSEPKDIGALGTPPPMMSETSNATLGSAAVASPVPPAWDPPRRQGKVAFLAAVVVLGAMAVTAIVLHGTGNAPTDRAAGAGAARSASTASSQTTPAPWTDVTAAKSASAPSAGAALGPDAGPEPTPPKVTPNGAWVGPGPAGPGSSAPVTPARPIKHRRVDDGF